MDKVGRKIRLPGLFTGVIGRAGLITGAEFLPCSAFLAGARTTAEAVTLLVTLVVGVDGCLPMLPAFDRPAGFSVGDEHSSSGDRGALGPAEAVGVPADLIDWRGPGAGAHGPPPFVIVLVGGGGLSPISTSSRISRT